MLSRTEQYLLESTDEAFTHTSYSQTTYFTNFSLQDAHPDEKPARDVSFLFDEVSLSAGGWLFRSRRQISSFSFSLSLSISLHLPLPLSLSLFSHTSLCNTHTFIHSLCNTHRKRSCPPNRLLGMMC